MSVELFSGMLISHDVALMFVQFCTKLHSSLCKQVTIYSTSVRATMDNIAVTAKKNCCRIHDPKLTVPPNIKQRKNITAKNSKRTLPSNTRQQVYITFKCQTATNRERTLQSSISQRKDITANYVIAKGYYGQI